MKTNEKPIPKYALGQEVWLIENNKVKSKIINGLGIRSATEYEHDRGDKGDKVLYTGGFSHEFSSIAIWHLEADLFPSKKDLIDSLNL